MIEKLLEEAVKPFESLLNWQRCVVFLVSILFLSPGFFGCFDVLLTYPTLVQFVQSITEAYAAIELVSFSVLLILVFYVSPNIVNILLKFMNGYFLKRQVNAIEKLIKYSEFDDEYFLVRFYEISEGWRSEKEQADFQIKYRTNFFEIILSFSCSMSLFNWLSMGSVYPAALLLLLCFLYGVYCAQKNISCYLSSVAPYKIAMFRFQRLNAGLCS